MNMRWKQTSATTSYVFTSTDILRINQQLILFPKSSTREIRRPCLYRSLFPFNLHIYTVIYLHEQQRNNNNV